MPNFNIVTVLVEMTPRPFELHGLHLLTSGDLMGSVGHGSVDIYFKRCGLCGQCGTASQEMVC